MIATGAQIRAVVCRINYPLEQTTLAPLTSFLIRSSPAFVCRDLSVQSSASPLSLASSDLHSRSLLHPGSSQPVSWLDPTWSPTSSTHHFPLLRLPARHVLAPSSQTACCWQYISAGLSWRGSSYGFSTTSSTTYNSRFTPRVEAHLQALKQRHEELSRRATEGGISGADARALHQELGTLEPLVAQLDTLNVARAELRSLQALASDPEEDPAFRSLAEEESRQLCGKATQLEDNLLLSMLPADVDDDKGAILEIRAGAGGDEAALFASELLDMYRLYAARRSWSFQVLATTSPADARASSAGGSVTSSGLKSAVVALPSPGAFGALKLEAGVHRVQRVPLTETQGRVHTSTASVVVLPEANEMDVTVREEDVRVDTYRSGGAGGQHVNVTNSAVRVTHLPTGLVATCQNERSQLRNRQTAMRVLCSRVYERERLARQAAESAERRASIGTGERNERIRTYNFPQGRVTDHRVGVTEHNIEQVMQGERLDVFIESLRQHQQVEQLAQMLE